MRLEIVHGDLLDQDVDCIVNAWNRNVIPWWLLLPQGVSRAIKKRGGYAPFRELGRVGPIPLGGAVATGAGRLPFKAIIHVAGINLLWQATEQSIRTSTRNAVDLASRRGFQSIALPLIGAGTGGRKQEWVLQLMREELSSMPFTGLVRIVRFGSLKIALTGEWLYDGAISASIRIVELPMTFGSGDNEDPPETQFDRNEPSYSIEYESPPGSGQFPAGGGQYPTLEDAKRHVEATIQSDVRWESNTAK